jgi:hypothetical protein
MFREWTKNKLFSSKRRSKVDTNAVVHNSNSSVDATTVAAPPLEDHVAANSDSGIKEELVPDPASDASGKGCLDSYVYRVPCRCFSFEADDDLFPSESTSVRTSIDTSPILVEATKKLSEAIGKLQDVCKTAKCMKEIPIVFDEQWAKSFIKGGSDAELPDGDFTTIVQQAVLAKSEENNQGVPARVGNVLQKVYPIAEVALGVGEYVDQVWAIFDSLISALTCVVLASTRSRLSMPSDYIRLHSEFCLSRGYTVSY